MESRAQLAEVLHRIDPTYLVPVLLLTALHFGAEPSRWQVYARGIGSGRPSSFAELFHIFSLTAMLSYLLPIKLGIPLRLALLKARLHLPLSLTSALLVLDGLIYYAAWAVVALLGVLAVARSGLVPRPVGEGIVYGLITTVALLTLWLLVIRLAPSLVPRTLIERLRRSSRQVATLTPRSVAAAMPSVSVIVLVDIAGQVFRHWAIIAMFSQSLPLAYVFAATTVAVFSGLISLLPMGIGAYDAILVLLLAAVRVPADIGLMVVLTNRFSSLAVSIALGALASLRLGINPFRAAWAAHDER